LTNWIHESLGEELERARTKAYVAHTEMILDYVEKFYADEVIHGLIDERRTVYNEFTKRIREVNKTP
jgi:hypothetical protein